MRPGLEVFTDWDSLTLDRIVRPAIFVEINTGLYHFKEIIGVLSGIPTIPTSFEYQALGNIEAIKFPKENMNGDRMDFSISLTAINDTFRTALMKARHDKDWPEAGAILPTCKISLWFFGKDELLLRYIPYVICVGPMDTCEIKYSSEGIGAVVTFACSDDWAWDRPIEGRYTDTYQKKQKSRSGDSYSADTGFRFIEALQNWDGFWIKPPAAKKRGKVTKHKKPPIHHS